MNEIKKRLEERLLEMRKELINYGTIPAGVRYLYKANMDYLKREIASLENDLKFFNY